MINRQLFLIQRQFTSIQFGYADCFVIFLIFRSYHNHSFGRIDGYLKNVSCIRQITDAPFKFRFGDSLGQDWLSMTNTIVNNLIDLFACMIDDLSYL